MRRAARTARHVASLLIALALLAAPVAGFTSKGQKNFRRGLEHEAAQRWEQAAEEFALAVGSSRVDLQACKLEYSIVSPK